REGLEKLAAKLDAGHKWLSPRDLDEAKVDVEGHRVSFALWFQDLAERSERIRAAMGQTTDQLTPIEKKAYEAGVRLVHYRTIRDQTAHSPQPVDLFVPRARSSAYIAFTGEVYKKLTEAARSGKGASHAELTPLEEDAASDLMKYLKGLQRDRWKVPG